MPLRHHARSLGLLAVLASTLALFAPAAQAGKYTVLHQFCGPKDPDCRDGFDVAAPLVRDSKGNLYGTAFQGGKFFGGTVFRLSPRANGQWRFDVLHDFCAKADCADGFDPMSAVIVDTRGNLYGVTSARVSSEAEDAVVYRLHPHGAKWDYEILHEFCNGAACDGAFVNQGLAYAGQAAGAAYDGVSPLFGVAGAGGANGSGLAFMLQPKNGMWEQTDLYSFCAQADCADGGNPDQPLVALDASHLYGVAPTGGPSGRSAVFELSTQDGTNWEESIVHAFCQEKHCADGGAFPSNLTLDAAGNLYGTTPTGGDCVDDFLCGTLFSIAPDGTETVLHAFCKTFKCHEGSDPGTGVVIGGDGTIYGTTRGGGGDDSSGIIYAFYGGTVTRLHSFCEGNCQEGGNSLSPMIIDPQGHLFGVTPEGDRGGEGGVVYEFVP